MVDEISEIMRRLDEIQERIESLEENSHVISEERIEVAGEGELGGEVEEEKNDGTITRKLVPVCDYCGKQMDVKQRFSICRKCSKKLCVRCAIEFRNQVICKKELDAAFGISRDDFKVLLMVGNGISGEGDMHTISGIPRGGLKHIVDGLKKRDYIEISWLGRKAMTASGREAFGCYSQILGGTADMRLLDREIARHVLSRK
jgi:hypothetical protein